MVDSPVISGSSNVTDKTVLDWTQSSTKETGPGEPGCNSLITVREDSDKKTKKFTKNSNIPNVRIENFDISSTVARKRGDKTNRSENDVNLKGPRSATGAPHFRPIKPFCQNHGVIIWPAGFPMHSW